MKGKSKTQKGITLIALIITIVVLLILAVVAISSITNDNILGYATNAAKDYNQAVKNEQEMLQEYVNFLNGNGGSGNGSTGETTNKISFTFNGNTYYAEEGMTWGEWLESSYCTDSRFGMCTEGLSDGIAYDKNDDGIVTAEEKLHNNNPTPTGARDYRGKYDLYFLFLLK